MQRAWKRQIWEAVLTGSYLLRNNRSGFYLGYVAYARIGDIQLDVRNVCLEDVKKTLVKHANDIF